MRRNRKKDKDQRLKRDRLHQAFVVSNINHFFSSPKIRALVSTFFLLFFCWKLKKKKLFFDIIISSGLEGILSNVVENLL